MRIAVEGCCHGELDAIYASLKRVEQETKTKIDLLLIGGDFQVQTPLSHNKPLPTKYSLLSSEGILLFVPLTRQAVRNNADLACIAMPEKYRRLGDFAAYYSAAQRAPILTIFIGGNHEASNYLHELFYGGWVAPNIYYLGCSGCVTYRGLRVAGLSGIYKRHDYRAGFHERLPFTEDTKRSIYHVRAFDVQKLLSLGGGRPDVFLSHDWPANVQRFGDEVDLLRRKPFFREEIERGDFGSPPGMEILRGLRPRYWFSAHLHVKFAAVVDHGEVDVVEEEEGEIDLDENEIKLDDAEGEIKLDDAEQTEGDEVEGMSPGKRPLSPSANNSETKRQRQETRTHETTRFLALDKCLPHRDFLQILDLQDTSTITDAPLSYDPHWLAITKTFHSFMSTAKVQPPLPSKENLQSMIEQNLLWVQEHIKDLKIQENFKIVAPVHNSDDPPQSRKQPPFFTNPQTVEFCKMLEIDESKMPR